MTDLPRDIKWGVKAEIGRGTGNEFEEPYYIFLELIKISRMIFSRAMLP